MCIRDRSTWGIYNMATQSRLDVQKTRTFVEEQFDKNILPSLMEYVRIPNLSRAFDPEWNTNGLLEKAANHLIDWVKKQDVKNLKTIELITEPGRTPLVYAEIEGTTPDCQTIIYYGHFDKQPHMTGWREGLSATNPVIQDGKLYGRGASDDGYAIYASVLSIKACQEQGLPHPRCVLFFEGDEESMSIDLPYYVEKLQSRIGTPSLMVCLDSGCGDYETLWVTNALRGAVSGNIRVQILNEGVHSGEASGIVPSSFRIQRLILDRLEDSKTGLVNERFHVNIPPKKYAEACVRNWWR
eukprot:TRINITY_DN1679_c0_g2_i2.p1 TRINITY_DN1679_c0_g2~~TRINITY_DN1679_c0_g2_i2.p1  ORF type:complete len:334 (+),score=132.74 TRINITY_DN1679_c0_g2_i2:109-1002(+)